MKKYNTEAIILRSINYKDKDKIYTLFTDKYGKISAIGRGVRKISSRRGGNLDSLNCVSIKLTESDNGFKNIDEVITIDSFRNVKSNYELGLIAYYFAEFVNKNIEEGLADIRVFKLFKKSLEILDSGMLDTRVVVLFFEIQILKELGYFPKLPSDEGVSLLIKKLLKGDFKDLDPTAINQTKLFIKDHIYSNLSNDFKSLVL